MTEIKTKYIDIGFEHDLLDAAIKNLEEKSNVLRFNNFAYSIRELSRHILHRLASDEEVKNCPWYSPNYDDKKELIITRGDRVRYAIHGGFDNNNLELLNLLDSIKKVNSNLTKTIELLNQYTHINPDTFSLREEETESKANKVIRAFNDFFGGIQSTRETLIDQLEDQIDEKIMNETLYSTISDVDITATHASIEDYDIQETTITNITSSNVLINVTGNIEVRQQYGSDGDQRRGDGYVTRATFPFEVTMQAPITKKLKYFSIKGNVFFNVDTSSFYGDDEEIDQAIEKEMTECLNKEK